MSRCLPSSVRKLTLSWLHVYAGITLDEPFTWRRKLMTQKNFNAEEAVLWLFVGSVAE